MVIKLFCIWWVLSAIIYQYPCFYNFWLCYPSGGTEMAFYEPLSNCGVCGHNLGLGSFDTYSVYLSACNLLSPAVKFQCSSFKNTHETYCAHALCVESEGSEMMGEAQVHVSYSAQHQKLMDDGRETSHLVRIPPITRYIEAWAGDCHHCSIKMKVLSCQEYLWSCKVI